MDMQDTKTRIIELVNGLDQPGKDAVIDYLNSSTYFARGCYKHHKEYGGLAQHSYEVYVHMRAHAIGLPEESIRIAALFHDLGKTMSRKSKDYVRGHGHRSVIILDSLGFELTPAERKAIWGHHDHRVSDYATCALLRQLSLGDCDSTGRWKRNHRR